MASIEEADDLLNRSQLEEALNVYTALVDTDKIGWATFMCGLLFDTPTPSRQRDSELAMTYYQKAWPILRRNVLSNESGRACCALGRLFYDGLGVNANKEEGVKFFRMSCE